jgi:hypothetical protein
MRRADAPFDFLVQVRNRELSANGFESQGVLQLVGRGQQPAAIRLPRVQIRMQPVEAISRYSRSGSMDLYRSNFRPRSYASVDACNGHVNAHVDQIDLTGPRPELPVQFRHQIHNHQIYGLD